MSTQVNTKMSSNYCNYDDESKQIFTAPTEIVFYIFSYFSLKELMRYRVVCRHWKEIIDELCSSDEKWRQFCVKEFKTLYATAKIKTRANLNWSDIYKSLTLWPRVGSAKEVKDEFATASSPSEQIINIILLPNSVIGVHMRKGIIYYDIETMTTHRDSKYTPIYASFIKYSQNVHLIVTLNDNFSLCVTSTSCGERATCNNVKEFLLVNDIVFFVTFNNTVYMFRAKDKEIIKILLFNTQEDVIYLSYTDNLHILTSNYNIFTYKGQLQFTCTLRSDALEVLRSYNMLEVINWKILLPWMVSVFKIPMPVGPMKEISVVYTYGDVILIGTTWGILRLYHIRDLSNLFQATPMKQWNFTEPISCPVSIPTIVQIDVLEGRNGHSIVVAMPKKIVIIDLLHDFGNSIRYALLPYEEVQKYKLLTVTV